MPFVSDVILQPNKAVTAQSNSATWTRFLLESEGRKEQVASGKPLPETFCGLPVTLDESMDIGIIRLFDEEARTVGILRHIN